MSIVCSRLCTPFSELSADSAVPGRDADLCADVPGRWTKIASHIVYIITSSVKLGCILSPVRLQLEFSFRGKVTQYCGLPLFVVLWFFAFASLPSDNNLLQTLLATSHLELKLLALRKVTWEGLDRAITCYETNRMS